MRVGRSAERLIHEASSATKEVWASRLPLRPVNYVWRSTNHYEAVQEVLFGGITAQLASEPSNTVGKPDPERNNLSLFIKTPAEFLLSHGVADKNYLFKRKRDGTRCIQDFEVVFVPGNWTKRRLTRSKRLDLRNVELAVSGWPRLDTLRAQPAHKSYERLAGPLPKILWAPTHDFRKAEGTGQSASSYPGFEPYLEQLSSFSEVETSLHPRNRKTKRPTEELLLETDYVISDFGTLVYEAWALGKVVIFPRWIIGDRVMQTIPNSAEANIYDRRIGHHAESFADLKRIVLRDTPNPPEVSEFMEQYLLNYRGGLAASRIAKRLTKPA